MLFHKDQHRLVEIHIRTPTARTAALSLEMQNIRDRRIIVVETHFLGAETEVQVFAVHEEVFVKAVQLFVDIAADAEERAANGIDFNHLVRVSVCHVIACKCLAFRKERCKANCLGNSRNNRRERTAACPLQRSVFVQDTATDRACIRMLFHELEHFAESVL